MRCVAWFGAGGHVTEPHISEYALYNHYVIGFGVAPRSPMFTDRARRRFSSFLGHLSDNAPFVLYGTYCTSELDSFRKPANGSNTHTLCG